MTKDYELYEPYRDWDPFVERQETASLKVESRKTRDKKKANKRKEVKEN